MILQGESQSTPRRWLVSPAFDLLLVSNVFWPLCLLAQCSDDFFGRADLHFWQVYFVTTPHRWITLGLIFLDQDRFRERRSLFLGIVLAAIAVCTTVRLTTGTLTCLLTVDYLWNAWHFAAQHHGIYRLYGRLVQVTPRQSVDLERWAFRFFLLYVTLRVAVATWTRPDTEAALNAFDFLVSVIPLVLIARDIITFPRRCRGGVVYLISVSSMYLCLLWAVHFHRPGLALAMTTASALFHGVEYLAVVTWSVRKSRQPQTAVPGFVGLIAAEWLAFLGTYLVVMGSAAWWLDQQSAQIWLLLNVVVAYLHYAFDGLIWRHRSPRTRPITAV